jgi:hypothetical protein
MFIIIIIITIPYDTIQYYTIITILSYKMFIMMNII